MVNVDPIIFLLGLNFLKLWKKICVIIWVKFNKTFSIYSLITEFTYENISGNMFFMEEHILLNSIITQ